MRVRHPLSMNTRHQEEVWFPAGEKHWHGATPTTATTHIAIQEHLDGKLVEWMEQVSDDQIPQVKEMHWTVVSPIGHLIWPRFFRAFSSGAVDTLTNPSKGLFMSRIKTIPPATESEQKSITTRTVIFPGESSVNTTNNTVNQKVRTTRKTVGIDACAC
jgi:hypothetical protein